MTAKKNIMREQRQEIQQLKQQINEQKRVIRAQKEQVECLKDQHNTKLTQIQWQAETIANSLREQFIKELTWLELCDDPNAKFATVKRAITNLRTIHG